MKGKTMHRLLYVLQYEANFRGLRLNFDYC